MRLTETFPTLPSDLISPSAFAETLLKIDPRSQLSEAVQRDSMQVAQSELAISRSMPDGERRGPVPI